jgi:uncharacterized protein YlxW (UPF0749 family)
MKNNESTIFVFIASIIVGLLIAMNIGFEGKSNFLDVKQYEVAYNERNKLYSEVNNLKNQYYNTYSKMQKYDHSDEKKHEVLSEIEKEINYNSLMMGTSDVNGQGVEITLDDGESNFGEYLRSEQLIHNSDIFQVINDLKNAGAEAISVNGERIIYDNYALCVGSSIDLNGIKIVTPFYIRAIGNQDVLYNYLTREQTHTKFLKLGEVKVNIVKADNIKILAYTGKLNYKYMKFTDK